MRFANAPIVWVVDDRLDVPIPPRKREFDHTAFVLQYVGHAPIDDVLGVPEPGRAIGINALGEVPDSTWFTNRIGRRPLGPKTVRHGFGADGPDLGGPLTVLETKDGGRSVGLLVEDRTGTRFLLKFDAASRPEAETAADVIVQRLLWAAGYGVPENTIVALERAQLVLAKGAVRNTIGDGEVPLRERDIDAALARSYRMPDGRWRCLASKFLPGKPLGGFPQRGVRKDDPNDSIPHEHRRELRGLYVFAAWVGHTDIKEDNTVDMWTQDPRHPDRHHVVHYLVDFGKALGVKAWTGSEPHDGHAHNFDYAYATGSLLTFGLWKRPWEGIERPPLRGVGMFDAEHFSPGRFRSRNRFIPFRRKDRFDAFWATKILMRFTPAHIRAAVEAGELGDPAAIEYIVRVLLERQQKTARHWFARVNPLDGFTVEPSASGHRVCATDLWLYHRLGRPEATRYELRAYDFDGRPTGPVASRRGRADGRVCADGIAPGPDHDGYVIVGFATLRPKQRRLAPVWLHLALGQSGTLRVIGIDRS